ncbi:MAG: ABC transporter substrate-binding protein [Archaeoglobus sp.]|nr:ABC transporter substrate-binding protein [Archaeoglobus sp.]
MRAKHFILGLILILALTGLTGCSQQQPKEKIKVGILPIEDALPFVVADEEGIFEKHGVDVEVIKFQSAMERDAALTSGQINAVLTDPLAVILLKNGGVDVKIVSLCLGKTPQEGVFTILAAPNSSINKLEDLEGKKIAISSNTIIEYVTDKMLDGVKAEKVEIKSIPLRLQTLLEGKIDAATLPEPLASLAAMKGAKKIISDADLPESISQTVIVFKGDFIKSNPDEVKKFLAAYDEVVERINSDPVKYRQKFIEIARVPKPLAESYKMPKYPESQVFPKEFYESYLKWTMEKKLIKEEISYEEAVYRLSKGVSKG